LRYKQFAQGTHPVAKRVSRSGLHTSVERGELTALEQRRDEFTRSCVVSPKTTHVGIPQGCRKLPEVLDPKPSKNAKNVQENARETPHGRF
jgi:hypothetical protein